MSGVHTRAARIGLMCAGLTGCAPTEVATTQLVVTVDGEPSVLARLRRVRATSYTTDATRSEERSGAHEFVLATPDGPAASARVEVPFSFAVVRGSELRVKLVIEGYDSLAPDAPPVIEQKRVATFRADLSLHLRIELSDRCHDLPNPCAGLDRTCWSEARACGPVPEADATPEPRREVDAGTSPACPAPSPCAAEYPCTLTAPTGYACLGQHTTWPVPLASSPTKPKYDTHPPNVVTDQITGLIWQRELPVRYEGCSGLSTVSGDRCTADEARIYCSRLRLLDRSWRLPSKAELESLLDYSGALPALDRSAFPGSNGAFWTSSPLPRATSDRASVTRYWATDFRTATAQLLAPTVPLLVRCVSGTPPGPSPPEDRLAIDAATDTVHDRGTGLIWQRIESAPLASVEEAMRHCAGLGGGWRLPHVKELLTVIDPARLDPALDPAFSLPRSGLAWARIDTPRGIDAWVVDVLLGASFTWAVAAVTRDARHAGNIHPHARCVRSAGDSPR